MVSADATMFIVSAPSGAGKTSLVTRLLSDVPKLACSVSHTTRPLRPKDTNGKDYHFVDRVEFEAMIDGGDFIEHAEVFGNYYGTSVAAVESCIDQGNDVILEIDWQGGAQVKASRPEVVWIFILPPSKEALLKRLRDRASDAEDVIARRTKEAVTEMREYERADYLVFNDEFEPALDELKAIIKCHRLGRMRQSKQHAALLKSLTQ